MVAVRLSYRLIGAYGQKQQHYSSLSATFGDTFFLFVLLLFSDFPVCSNGLVLFCVSFFPFFLPPAQQYTSQFCRFFFCKHSFLRSTIGFWLDCDPAPGWTRCFWRLAIASYTQIFVHSVRIGIWGLIECLLEPKCTTSRHSPLRGLLVTRFSLRCWACVCRWGRRFSVEYNQLHPNTRSKTNICMRSLHFPRQSSRTTVAYVCNPRVRGIHVLQGFHVRTLSESTISTYDTSWEVYNM